MFLDESSARMSNSDESVGFISETKDNSEQLKKWNVYTQTYKKKDNDSHGIDRDLPTSSGWFLVDQDVHFSDTFQPEVQFEDILFCLMPHIYTEQRKLKSRDWVLLGEFATRGANNFPVHLADALHDLDGIAEEAKEEGFPVPEVAALNNAEQILRDLYAISPRRYEVYPMPDGEIAIDAPDCLGSSVLLLCDSGGGALCMVNMKGKHRRARYSTTEALPDGFIREAMAELER